MRNTCIAVALACSGALGAMSFVSEVIDIVVVDSTTFRVDAAYVFRHDSVSGQGAVVFYPVPTDSTHTFPSEFTARADGRPAPFRPQPDGSGFHIELPHRAGLCTLSVSYSQQVLKGPGRYILTSTSAWGKPLKWGEYSVTVPQQYTLVNMNYPCDRQERSDVGTVCRFRKTDFRPKRDILFSWIAQDSGRKAQLEPTGPQSLPSRAGSESTATGDLKRRPVPLSH